MHDADLAHERDYVAGLYARLDELRTEKRTQLAQVRRAGAVGTMQNVSERDAFAALYEDRLAQLDAVDDRLVFGRLDLDSGEAQYIGRIGLTTEDLQRLMVDWRAPEAGHFYQATAFDRQGVRRRRHLILQGREVKAIEDDVLDADMLADNDSLQGEGALLAALNSKRTGRMSDIVGTIQSEQDRIIRSSISGALVVQGGPGTGKTAVALHRAAYLLYTHRDRLKSAGVLLVGPTSSFMKYIERVLPSLGETGVVMASLGRLMPGVHCRRRTGFRRRRHQGPAGHGRGGGERRRQPAAHPGWKPHPRGRRPQARPHAAAGPPRQGTGARHGKPHNEARVSFVKILLRELTEQMTKLVEAGNIGNDADRSYLAEDVRSARDVRIALNLCWMPMTPEKLVGELLSKPAILEACTPNLSPEERALLLRPAGSPWTESDVPLLDEAAELLGELDAAAGRGLAQQEQDRARDLANAKQTLVNMETAGVDVLVTAEDLVDQNQERETRLTAAERATTDRTWAFGHIVVDEAQELSPMQWRLLVRRCPLKSFTIVGDIAQTSSVAGANSWQQRPAAPCSATASARGTDRQLPHAVADRRGRRPDGQRGRPGGVGAQGRPGGRLVAGHRPSGTGPDRQQARRGAAREDWNRHRRRPAGGHRRRRASPGGQRGAVGPFTATASAPARAATRRTSWCSARANPRAWSSTSSWSWNRRPCSTTSTAGWVTCTWP